MYVYVCSSVRMRVHACMHMQADTCTHVHVHVQVCAHECAHPCALAPMGARVHGCTHSWVHMHVRSVKQGIPHVGAYIHVAFGHMNVVNYMGYPDIQVNSDLSPQLEIMMALPS